MSTCTEKHTKPQVPDEAWRCPSCGAPAHPEDKDPRDGWIVEDSCGSDDCELLHLEDFLECNRCGRTMSGKAYARWYVRTSNLVPCQHCKGKGFVAAQATSSESENVK